MRIAPITFRDASDYINKLHRHHRATVGCKFCICVVDDDGQCHGVAVCGRPVSRRLDDGFTLEVNRVCSDGTRNVCSMLYGACCRIGPGKPCFAILPTDEMCRSGCVNASMRCMPVNAIVPSCCSMRGRIPGGSMITFTTELRFAS